MLDKKPDQNLVEKIKPIKTILTNINSDIDHDEVKKYCFMWREGGQYTKKEYLDNKSN